MKDYYRILEISPSASVEVIKASYRALAKKYHPDTQTSSNMGKTMADIMVKILMKGAKAIGKTAVILIIWTAHKLENK